MRELPIFLLILQIAYSHFLFCAYGEDIPIQGITYPAEYARSNTTYLIQGELTHLLFCFWGDKASTNDARLIVDLPEDIQVADAFQLGGGKSITNIVTTVMTREGKEYSRATIPLRQNLICDRLPSKVNMDALSNCLLFLETKTNRADKKALFWHLECGGQKGQEKTLVVAILPPLTIGPLPKRFKGYFYVNTLFQCPNATSWERLFKLYTRIGIGGSVQHYSWETVEKLAARDWRVVTAGGQGWGQWGAGEQSYWGVSNPGEVLKTGMNDKDILITLKNGTKTAFNRNICQTYLLENSAKGQPYFDQIKKNLLQCYRQNVKIYGMINDYEMLMKNEISPVNSCFCDRCKKAFAQHAKIAMEKLRPLSGQEILALYGKEWLLFRYEQNSKMMEIQTRVVKDIDPGLKSIVCSMDIIWSGYPNYPIDMMGYDAYIDEHWPMMYRICPLAFYSTEQTVMRSAKTVVPIFNTCYPIGEHRMDSAEDLYLNILSAAIAGAKGMCVFSGDISLDGEYIAAIGKAMSEIAVVEDLLWDGQKINALAKVERPDWSVGESWVLPLVDYRVHILPIDRKIILSLLNYSNREATLKITLPKIQTHIGTGKYFIYNPIDRTLVKKSKDRFWTAAWLKEGVEYKVDARSVKFLEVSKEDPGF